MTDGPAKLARTARRTGVVIVAVALVLLVGAAALYAVPQLAGADRSYVVLSGSMEPAIAPGDVVVVETIDPTAIRDGDVITFDRGESYPTTHRVIEIQGAGPEIGFVTKGDANIDADPAIVRPSQIVGRVQSVGGHLLVIPMFGYLVQFANTNTGTVLVLFIPLALLILNEVYIRLSDRQTPDRVSGEKPDPAESGDIAEVAVAEAVPTGTQVGRLDLTLTLLVLLVVVPYSGYMTFETREPLSAMVLAGGLTGLALIAYVRARLWYDRRRRRSESGSGATVEAVEPAVGHKDGDD